MPGDFIPSILKAFKASSSSTVEKSEIDVINASLEVALAAVDDLDAMGTARKHAAQTLLHSVESAGMNVFDSSVGSLQGLLVEMAASFSSMPASPSVAAGNVTPPRAGEAALASAAADSPDEHGMELQAIVAMASHCLSASAFILACTLLRCRLRCLTEPETGESAGKESSEGAMTASRGRLFRVARIVSTVFPAQGPSPTSGTTVDMTSQSVISAGIPSVLASSYGVCLAAAAELVSMATPSQFLLLAASTTHSTASASTELTGTLIHNPIVFASTSGVSEALRTGFRHWLIRAVGETSAAAIGVLGGAGGFHCGCEALSITLAGTAPLDSVLAARASDKTPHPISSPHLAAATTMALPAELREGTMRSVSRQSRASRQAGLHTAALCHTATASLGALVASTLPTDLVSAQMRSTSTMFPTARAPTAAASLHTRLYEAQLEASTAAPTATASAASAAGSSVGGGGVVRACRPGPCLSHASMRRVSYMMWAEAALLSGRAMTLSAGEAFTLPDADDSDEEDAAAVAGSFATATGKALRAMARRSAMLNAVMQAISTALGQNAQSRRSTVDTLLRERGTGAGTALEDAGRALLEVDAADCASRLVASLGDAASLRALAAACQATEWGLRAGRAGEEATSWRGGDPRSQWIKSVGRMLMVSADLEAATAAAAVLGSPWSGAGAVSTVSTAVLGHCASISTSPPPTLSEPSSSAPSSATSSLDVSSPAEALRAAVTAGVLLSSTAALISSSGYSVAGKTLFEELALLASSGPRGTLTDGSVDMSALRRATGVCLTSWMAEQQRHWVMLVGWGPGEQFSVSAAEAAGLQGAPARDGASLTTPASRSAAGQRAGRGSGSRGWLARLALCCCGSGSPSSATRRPHHSRAAVAPMPVSASGIATEGEGASMAGGALALETTTGYSSTGAVGITSTGGSFGRGRAPAESSATVVSRWSNRRSEAVVAAIHLAGRDGGLGQPMVEAGTDESLVQVLIPLTMGNLSLTSSAGVESLLPITADAARTGTRTGAGSGSGSGLTSSGSGTGIGDSTASAACKSQGSSSLVATTPSLCLLSDAGAPMTPSAAGARALAALISAQHACTAIATAWITLTAREHVDTLLSETGDVGTSIYASQPTPPVIPDALPAMPEQLALSGGSGFSPSAPVAGDAVTDGEAKDEVSSSTLAGTELTRRRFVQAVSAVWSNVKDEAERLKRACGASVTVLPTETLPAALTASAPTPSVTPSLFAMEALGFPLGASSSSVLLVEPSDRARRLMRGLLLTGTRAGMLGGETQASLSAATTCHSFCLALTGHALRYDLKIGVCGTLQLAADLAFARVWVLAGCPTVGRKQEAPACLLSCIELAAARSTSASDGNAGASFESGRALLNACGKKWRFHLSPPSALVAASVPGWRRSQVVCDAMLSRWHTSPQLRKALGLPSAVPKEQAAPSGVSSADHPGRSSARVAPMPDTHSAGGGVKIGSHDTSEASTAGMAVKQALAPPAVWGKHPPGSVASEEQFEGFEEMWRAVTTDKTDAAAAAWVKNESAAGRTALAAFIARV